MPGGLGNGANPIFISLRGDGVPDSGTDKRRQRRKVDEAPQVADRVEVARTDQAAVLGDLEVLPHAASPVELDQLDPQQVRAHVDEHPISLDGPGGPAPSPTVIVPEVLNGDAFEPAHQAHELRMTGMSWADVARRTGYSSASTCQMAVSAYYQRVAMEMTAERQRLAREQILAQLDELIQAWRALALTGDKDAAAVYLKVLAQRARIERVEDEDRTKGGGTRTIVIHSGASEEEYVSGLRKAIESGGEAA